MRGFLSASVLLGLIHDIPTILFGRCGEDGGGVPLLRHWQDARRVHARTHKGGLIHEYEACIKSTQL
jgi:hypothetical protein